MDRARRQVIGKYRKPEEVRATLQRLERDGYTRDDVTLYTHNKNIRDFQDDYEVDMLADETRVVDKSEDNRSFWDEIKDMVSYNTSDEKRMTDEENQLIGPYREDIDNGYTVIAVREGITNLSGAAETKDRTETIPEAGAKYHPNEEPVTDRPDDAVETDRSKIANENETQEKYIEHEDVERIEEGSAERFYTVDGQMVVEPETTPNETAHFDVNANDKAVNEENEGHSSAEHDTNQTVNEPESDLDRELTNKDDTLFDDPNPSYHEDETVVESKQPSPSDEIEKREEDYNRLDPDNDIRYDPKHRDMDL